MLYILLFLISGTVFAISDQETLLILQGLEEWEAAYPFAYQQAKQQNDYQALKQTFIQYQNYDKENKVYISLWVKTYQLDNNEIYQDFIQLNPDSHLNNLAIHRLYLKTENTIEDYLDFIKTYPNSIEAIQALLKIHQLAFEKAKKVNYPEYYDEFVETFKGAEQSQNAIMLAFKAEQKAVEQRLLQEDKESVARRLFNQARIAERHGDLLQANRKYQLLEQEIFFDTKVYTEYLDREERLIFQQLVLKQQQEINDNIIHLQDNVIASIQHQTQSLFQILSEQNQKIEGLNQQLASHNEQLNQVIAQYNGLMEKQLQVSSNDKLAFDLVKISKDLSDPVKTTVNIVTFTIKHSPKIIKFFQNQ